MREPKIVTIEDGYRQINIRVTPFDAYRGSRFLVKVGCLIGAPAMSSALSSMTAENLIGKLATMSVAPESAQALLDELLTCCERIADDGKAVPINASTVAGQIESPETIFLLWVAALRASFDFFEGGKWSAFLAKVRSTWQQAG